MDNFAVNFILDIQARGIKKNKWSHHLTAIKGKDFSIASYFFNASVDNRVHMRDDAVFCALTVGFGHLHGKKLPTLTHNISFLSISSVLLVISYCI